MPLLPEFPPFLRLSTGLLDDGGSVTGPHLCVDVVSRAPRIDPAGEEVAEPAPVLHQDDESRGLGGKGEGVEEEA